MRSRCSGTARRLCARTSLLVLVVALGGCNAAVHVEVRAREDGSGFLRASVGLDERAAARFPDLAGNLRLDDLRAAGWRIVGPRVEPDGRTWVRASHRFATPAEAERIATQLSGADGPFQDFKLTRHRDLLRTRTAFSGVVDLSRGIEAFSDAELARLLGHPLGATPAELERVLGVPLAEALSVRVEATLLDGPARRWTPVVGERLPLTLVTDITHTSSLVLLGIAALCVLALLALGIAAVVDRGGRSSESVTPSP